MTAENVAIQDLLTALLYWRGEAKEYERQNAVLRCQLANIDNMLNAATPPDEYFSSPAIRALEER